METNRITALLGITLVTISLFTGGAAAAVPSNGGATAGASPATTPGSAVPAMTNNTTTATTANNTTTATTANNTANLSTGQLLSATLAATKAHVHGLVQQFTFEVELEQSNTNSSKAQLVANQTKQLHKRLRSLRVQRQTLRKAYQNGSISRSAYVTQMAALGESLAQVKALVNQTNATAQQLPPSLLESHGVNATTIEELRTEAGDLSGGDVAEIAHSINEHTHENESKDHAKGHGHQNESEDHAKNHDNHGESGNTTTSHDSANSHEHHQGNDHQQTSTGGESGNTTTSHDSADSHEHHQGNGHQQTSTGGETNDSSKH